MIQRNREGLTYSEWFAAASYGVPRGNLSPPWGQLRRAWRAGVDPTEIAAAGWRAWCRNQDRDFGLHGRAGYDEAARENDHGAGPRPYVPDAEDAATRYTPTGSAK